MIKIAFVCIGNICRSPAMQAIFSRLVEEAGLEDQFYIDSFGINPSFMGCDMTEAMRKLLEKKGIVFHHKAQIFEEAHFETFDYIIVATKRVKEVLFERAPKHRRGNIHLLTEFSNSMKGEDIPDPYLKSEGGYQIVFDILEQACHDFFHRVIRHLA